MTTWPGKGHFWPLNFFLNMKMHLGLVFLKGYGLYREKIMVLFGELRTLKIKKKFKSTFQSHKFEVSFFRCN